MCEAYRNSQRTQNPMPFAHVEAEVLTRAYLAHHGRRDCPVCKAEKPLAEFHKTGRCIECRRAETIAHKRNARARKAASEGREFAARTLQDAHVEAHRKHFAAECRRLARMMAAAVRVDDAEDYRRRYRECPEFQTKERLRRQLAKQAKRDGIAENMRQALRRNGQSRRVEQVLGYTISELRAHLEARFTDGMSWDAYMRGQIHIDHVMPQAAFDLSDPEQWRQCWALSNLQPLWARDNLAKSDLMPCGGRGRAANDGAFHAVA